MLHVPAAFGAYILQFDLHIPLVIPRRSPPDWHLPVGRYLYCGNAYGPGGLAARVGRHLKAVKKHHWHVDYLSSHTPPSAAWICEGGNECVLVAGLGPLPIPIPGFGASDCPTCASHLLAWPDGLEIDFKRLNAVPFRL